MMQTTLDVSKMAQRTPKMNNRNSQSDEDDYDQDAPFDEGNPVIIDDFISVNNKTGTKATQNKRKHQQELKSKHEKKRRMKFNNQLDTLRSLLCTDDVPDNKKLTREYLLNCAIDEIKILRQKVHQFETTFNADLNGIQHLLNRPPSLEQFVEISTLGQFTTRIPCSAQELEKTFQTIFAREFNRFFDINSSRTEQTVWNTVKMLETLASQIGKQEYMLSAGMLEQIYHASLKFNPKEFTSCLKRNWKMYQEVKKTVRENPVLLLDGEVGAWILCDMSLMEYMTGNTDASERTWGFAKQLCKKVSHKGTTHMMLAALGWTLKGTVSVSTAAKIYSMLQKDYYWEPMALLLEGRALIAAGRHKEGLNEVEHAVSQLVERIGDSGDLLLVPSLLDAYVQTRSVEKGLWIANYLLNKCASLGLEGYLGKSELLRQKANLLIIQRHPDYIVDSQITSNIEPAIHELLVLADNQGGYQMTTVRPVNDTLVLHATTTMTNTQPENAYEDIEGVLQAAMHLAHSQGLYTVELWCAMDWLRFLLYGGQKLRARELVPVLKDIWARMKGSENTKEFQKLKVLISLVEGKETQ